MADIMDSKLEYIKGRGGRILDIGATEKQSLREFFTGLNYKTLDMEPTGGADYIADAHSIPTPDAHFDSVIAFSLIEHTHSPHIVVKEIHRVLKPGGVAFTSTPFIHPYHPGRCPDYYRFTKDGLRYLFKDFSSVEVYSDGGLFLALTYFIPPGLRPLRTIIKPVFTLLDTLFTKNRSSAHQLMVFARK